MANRNPLPDPQLRRVRDLASLRGRKFTAAALGCSRPTLDRILGGLDLNPGTIALVNIKLATRDQEGKVP